MIIRDKAGEYRHIKCDNCEAISPPAQELLKHHGLVNMGWYCSGGKHRCPKHFAQETV